jgi:hypothetical protein
MYFILKKRKIRFENSVNFSAGRRGLFQPNTQYFSDNGGIRFAMWTDSVHGIFDLEKFLAGTVESAQPGASRVHERLVNIEKE